MNIRVIEKKSPIEMVKNPPVGWEKVFSESQDEIEFSMNKVSNYKNIVPSLDCIFEMHQRMDPKNIKIAIFTDEPDYETWEQMHGCGISGSDKNPPSYLMKQIHNRLFETVENMIEPKHNSLQKWIDQGIFISSIYLTRGQQKNESHKPLWGEFTIRCIRHICQVNPNVIFFFWGHDASTFKTYTTKQTTFVINSFGKNDKNSIYTMNHFNEANRILEARKRKKIDWNL